MKNENELKKEIKTLRQEKLKILTEQKEFLLYSLKLSLLKEEFSYVAKRAEELALNAEETQTVNAALVKLNNR